MDSPKNNVHAPKVYLNRNVQSTMNQELYSYSSKDHKISKQLKLVLEQQARLERSLLKFHQIINNLMVNSKNATNVLSSHLKLLHTAINEEAPSPARNEALLKLMRKPFYTKNLKKIYTNGQSIDVRSLIDLNESNGTATFLTAENRMLVLELTHINGLELEQ